MNQIVNENRNLSQQFQNMQTKQYRMLENIEEEISFEFEEIRTELKETRGENLQKLDKIETELQLLKEHVDGLSLTGRIITIYSDCCNLKYDI